MANELIMMIMMIMMIIMLSGLLEGHVSASLVSSNGTPNSRCSVAVRINVTVPAKWQRLDPEMRNILNVYWNCKESRISCWRSGPYMILLYTCIHQISANIFIWFIAVDAMFLGTKFLKQLAPIKYSKNLISDYFFFWLVLSQFIKCGF